MVKKVENECKFDNNITVIDLKLDAVGAYEDAYYSTFPLLIKNIRRGNTFVGVRSAQEGGYEYIMARKGLMKFFDLRLPFISKQERKCLEYPKYKEDLQVEKNYILAPVLKAIAEGHQVEVLKTLKANGENVQISYVKEVKSWMVSSKNVGMLVRNRDDIKLYESTKS